MTRPNYSIQQRSWRVLCICVSMHFPRHPSPFLTTSQSAVLSYKCTNFRTKLSRQNLKLPSQYISEKENFCPVSIFSLLRFFSLSLSGKNKQSKTINETGQNCIFRKYTASDALNCAAAVLFGNSYHLKNQLVKRTASRSLGWSGIPPISIGRIAVCRSPGRRRDRSTVRANQLERQK